MPPADGHDADPKLPCATSGALAGQVDAQLVEALVLLLVEKGVLTRNDSLSIVQTVAQVQRGAMVEEAVTDPRIEANLQMLNRMYRSFQAMAEQPAGRGKGWNNVHRLRPPVHNDRPEFPEED